METISRICQSPVCNQKKLDTLSDKMLTEHMNTNVHAEAGMCNLHLALRRQPRTLGSIERSHERRAALQRLR